MPEFICNTSPLQYLHQLGLLEILPRLTGGIVIPHTVEIELAQGRQAGWDLPDPRSLPWVTIRQPRSTPALPLASDLGTGESGVLALALESSGPIVILDDGLARRVAETLRIPLTGTLGLLIDAKHRGLIPSVAECLDELARLRFRTSAITRQVVLRMAGEA